VHDGDDPYHKGLLFFTADARFLRSAMNHVARHLRGNDAGLTLVNVRLAAGCRDRGVGIHFMSTSP
jgi:hypothetical protein